MWAAGASAECRARPLTRSVQVFPLWAIGRFVNLYGYGPNAGTK
jgi:hypothetical protein